MKLTEPQKRHLRKLAHARKPVVLIGQHGLSENVMREIEQAIAHHELIKIRISGAEREERKAMIGKICAEVNASLVQQIGHVAVLFRRSHKARIRFPGKED